MINNKISNILNLEDDEKVYGDYDCIANFNQ